jgi:1-aminocyclopropane-1-carboxylate deaminase
MLALPFEPPIQKIETATFREYNIDVYLKREDLIHPFISGNKWRKLKYILEDAKNLQCNNLISFGGAYSNHLVALACAGAMFGFTTEAFIRGEVVNNQMLSLCKVYGMKLHFVSREAYQHKRELFNQVATSESYFIDEGGKGPLAIKGCTEILDQVEGYSHVISAVGTGTTLAGLIQGAAGKGMRVEGICVLKGAETISNEVNEYVYPNQNWTIHHQFHGGGYAKTNPELLEFIHSFAAQTGILLDQVYTAKMMQGVAALVKQRYYETGDKLLLIHTGGLLGLLSQF